MHWNKFSWTDKSTWPTLEREVLFFVSDIKQWSFTGKMTRSLTGMGSIDSRISKSWIRADNHDISAKITHWTYFESPKD